ncbi:MAG: hypothetical protein IJT04_09010 [Bacteroidales bacterium]|nr:hypothetical protein [Bacteroidales bacterium]
MGAWGTALYSNDICHDVRSDYIDKLKHGKTSEEATKELINENLDIMGDVEEEPLFWFALADTQWDYGRLLLTVKEKALYFLGQGEELQRWQESGQDEIVAWAKTLIALKKKLESTQPKIKRITKYRLYNCEWKMGDVFAYRFSSDYSKEKGFEGQYAVFRKVSEDTWWPGHIVPVVQIYNRISHDIPTIDKLPKINLLPAFISPSTLTKHPNIKINYNIKLLSESKKMIPTDNLVFLGNLPGDDLILFRGHDYWTGYGAVGWESSRYNEKFEHYVIDMYLTWKDNLIRTYQSGDGSAIDSH